MQRGQAGYLALSLGYFTTLFTTPGQCASSEITLEGREAGGLHQG